MLISVSLNIVLFVLLGLSLFALVFILLVLRYKTKVFNRKLETQAIQLNKYAKENKSYKSQLDEMVHDKTKDFHEQMELNKELIADRKIALKKANEANFLKNAFLSNMSHEIRTPLNSIMGFSDLLLSEFSGDKRNDLFEYSQAISRSSERLMQLLNNLIDISRVDANDYEVSLKASNINKSLEKVYDIFILKAQEKHLKFNLVNTEVPDSQFDISILERVIAIIVDNAIKYTDAGYINISSMFKTNENKLLIRIKDTGVGIDDSFLTEIFAPFRQESFGYSKSHQGAGLGLPLAKKLLKLINGEIQVKSKKMEGTVFSIFIPYIPVNEAKEASAIKHIEKISKSVTLSINTENVPKILVVEDDKMNKLVFKKMLGNISELTICSNGDEALEMFEETFNNNNSFDMVLMDINLPAPWDGIEVMKEVKSKFIEAQKIPFIAQTAYAMSGDREKMLREGFDDYIAKPIDKAELFHVIEQNLKNETL